MQAEETRKYKGIGENKVSGREHDSSNAATSNETVATHKVNSNARKGKELRSRTCCKKQTRENFKKWYKQESRAQLWAGI